jgi:hypothetical protein
MRLSWRSGAVLGVLSAAEVALLGLGDAAMASPNQHLTTGPICQSVSFLTSCGVTEIYTGSDNVGNGNYVYTGTQLEAVNVDIAPH